MNDIDIAIAASAGEERTRAKLFAVDGRELGRATWSYGVRTLQFEIGVDCIVSHLEVDGTRHPVHHQELKPGMIVSFEFFRP